MAKKTANAKIFDASNGNFLSDIDVEIELIFPSNPNEKPKYEVTGKILKQFVEISDKNLILEFKPELRGSALFSILGLSPWFTEFKIYLQDSVWWNLEWFESL